MDRRLRVLQLVYITLHLDFGVEIGDTFACVVRYNWIRTLDTSKIDLKYRQRMYVTEYVSCLSLVVKGKMVFLHC